jgi:hypothetical protein
MAATVGQGIADAMHAADDEPITNEWTEFAAGAKIVKAYGRKGLYVSSDDSGGWITTGPLPLAE